MDLPKIERWDFEQMGLMTLDKIRDLFTPADHFRVSKQEYPAGVEFSEASREGPCYVLQGQVTYRFDEYDVELSLSAGEFANFPSGSYRVLIGKNEAASLVKVWELPAEFWAN